jgi:hypothetical protein
MSACTTPSCTGLTRRRSVYGEDVEAALRFLFNAMAPKPEEGFAFQGIPEALYLDNGPIAKSRVFHSVMEHLGVQVLTHLPAGKDGRGGSTGSRVHRHHSRPACSELLVNPAHQA